MTGFSSRCFRIVVLVWGLMVLSACAPAGESVAKEQSDQLRFSETRRFHLTAPIDAAIVLGGHVVAFSNRAVRAYGLTSNEAEGQLQIPEPRLALCRGGTQGGIWV